MPEDPTPATRGQHSRDISDAIVRLTREHTGRGPVRARTVMSPEAVVVLLRGTLTKAEQTLVEHDHAEEVLAMRRAFQEVLRPSFIAEVERITGRTVTTFMSTNTTEPDHAAEIFLFD